MAKSSNPRISKRGKNLQVLGFIISLIILSFPNILADSTQQYNKIFLNPVYRPSMSQNTNYTYTVNVTPPDGVSAIKSAIISFEVYITPTVTFFGYVDGRPCNTQNYTISTTYASSGLGKINFDCSNQIKKSGNYTFTLRPTQANTGASTGWLDLTYMNNPSSIDTRGTEYQPNDNARIFARLLDGNSRPINIASCNSTVYYPNNTKLLNSIPLTLLEKGIYYYDFITPNVTGNYITVFDCVTPSIPFRQNVTLQGIHMEAGESDQYYEVDFGFDNSNNITINSAYLEVSVTGSIAGCIVGVDFNNKRLGTLTGQTPAIGNYTLIQNDFYITDEQKLVLTREGTGVDYLWWTRLVVNYTWNDPQQLIRGQNEVHVTNVTSSISNQLNNIPSQVWNYTPNRNLTYYPNVTADVNYTYFNQQFNQTWTNLQTIYSFLQTMNSTIINNYFIPLMGNWTQLWSTATAKIFS
jgi:hypothetical protein